MTELPKEVSLIMSQGHGLVEDAMFGPLTLYDVINNCATLAGKTANPGNHVRAREYIGLLRRRARRTAQYLSLGPRVA